MEGANVVEGTANTPQPDDNDVADLEHAACDLDDIWNHAIDDLRTTLPPSQLRALLTIDRHGALSLNALAAHLRSSTSATSRLCDRLRQADLITRTPASTDRRAIVLQLSDAGTHLIRWARHRRRTTLAHILADMTPRDRQALLQGLRAFRTAAHRDR
jgi:DNA-binding MarR family transcriptional regulator